MNKPFARKLLKKIKRLSPIILQGNLYRLYSPHKTNHAAVMHVGKVNSKPFCMPTTCIPDSEKALFLSNDKDLIRPKTIKSKKSISCRDAGLH